MMKSMFRFIQLALLCISLAGCGSLGKKLKAFLGGKEYKEESTTQTAAPLGPTFSNNPNYLTGPKRKYRRATKKSLSQEAQLSSEAGSLWVDEGQGAFLFSQNIMRMVGDPLSIRIQGEPKQQLQTKVNVIRDLLQRLEDRQTALRAPAAAKQNAQQGSGAAAPKPAPAPTPQEKDFPVAIVPTRITERLIDGNYRVKGGQTFMIKNREYKVIVTGIVRAEDFNDEGISATKLLDPRFDIVGVRKKESL